MQLFTNVLPAQSLKKMIRIPFYFLDTLNKLNGKETFYV